MLCLFALSRGKRLCICPFCQVHPKQYSLANITHITSHHITCMFFLKVFIFCMHHNSCHHYKYQANLTQSTWTLPSIITDCGECLANMATHHWTRAPKLYHDYPLTCMLVLTLITLCSLLVVGWLNFITHTLLWPKKPHMPGHFSVLSYVR